MADQHAESGVTHGASTPPAAAARPARRRRWQYGLRTLLVLMLLAGLASAWLAKLYEDARQQQEAVAALEKVGVSVYYDDGTDDDGEDSSALSKWTKRLYRRVTGPVVVALDTEESRQLADDDLNHLRGLPHVEELLLWGTQITDAGLVHLRHVPRLSRLDLSGTGVGDAGMAELQGLSRLEDLDLSRTRITDGGLTHLRLLRTVSGLDLSDTAIGDAGVAQLRGLTHLRFLSLAGTRVSDSGLQHVCVLPRLDSLGLSRTAVTDAGLEHLRFCRNLETLFLAKTCVTDEGLAALSGLRQLRRLDLTGTNITGKTFAVLGDVHSLLWLDLRGTKLDDAGLANLQTLTSLDRVKIESTSTSDAAIDALRRQLPDLSVQALGLSFDGLTFHQLYFDDEFTARWGVRDKSVPNGMLLQWAVGFGRTEWDIPPRLQAALENDTREAVNVSGIPLTDELRTQLGRLRNVRWLYVSAGVTAHDLEWIGRLTQLRGLSLRESALSGADFAQLKELASLQWLDLTEASMSARDFETFPRLERLETLYLAGPNITDECVRHVASLRMPALGTLCLTETPVTDAGLIDLCTNYDLELLSLYLCRGITGKSVDAIGGMKHLVYLNVASTGLAPQGAMTPDAERVRRLLPRCWVDVKP